MRNHQLNLGSIFGTLLIVVVSGCGSSASDGGVGTGGANASTGADSSATGGSAIGAAGGSSTTASADSTFGGGLTTGSIAVTFGGNANTGGTRPAAATGVLGQQCSPPGALGCNGINQKLTLVCGADGNWQTNQTCNSATQVCDPRPGSTQGTCQEQDPVCSTLPVGQQYCTDYAEWTCDAWAMKATKVRDCEIGPCSNGKCTYGSGCLISSNFLSCSDDCASVLDASATCSSARADVSEVMNGGVDGSAVVRVDYSDSESIDVHLSAKCETRRFYRIVGMDYERAYVRVQVQAPWGVTKLVGLLSCTDAPSACLVLSPGVQIIGVFTDDASSPPANVYVEATSTQPPACPGS